MNKHCHYSVKMEEAIHELYAAAESGDVAELLRVNDMLPQGSNVFMPIPPGEYTALHIAAYHGHKTFVQKLLTLYYANKSLNLECLRNTFVEQLVAICANALNLKGHLNFLKARDAYEKNTALHEAVKGEGNLDIVKLLLKADPTLANDRNKDGESPLFIAAKNGHLNAVKELLPRTHRPYERSDGRTPLHQAMYRKHYDVAKELSRNHELVKAEDIEGRTVLHVAALLHGFPEDIVEQLLEHDVSLCYKKDKINQRTALHIAATEGNVDFVKCILRRARRSAEIVDEDGRYALHLAVEKGDVNIVQELLRSMSRRSLEIALHLAVEKGDVNTVKQLLESRPSLKNVPDDNGCTIQRTGGHVEWTLVDYNGRQVVRNVKTLSQPTIPDANEQSSSQAIEQRESDQINALSVMAVLIATLSFQALIQPPGGIDDKTGHPVLGDRSAFKYFMVANALGFFLSMFAAISLIISLLFPTTFLPKSFIRLLTILARYYIAGVFYLVDASLWCMIIGFIMAGFCYGVQNLVSGRALWCMISFFWIIFMCIPSSVSLYRNWEEAKQIYKRRCY